MSETVRNDSEEKQFDLFFLKKSWITLFRLSFINILTEDWILYKPKPVALKSQLTAAADCWTQPEGRAQICSDGGAGKDKDESEKEREGEGRP